MATLSCNKDWSHNIVTSLLHEALKKMNTRQKRPSINDIGSYFGFYDPPLPTLVESSRIYTGQYTFPILLLNDDKMLGEHTGKEKNVVYGTLL